LFRILYFTRDFTTHDHRFLTALAQTDHQVYYLRLEQRGHSLEDRALPPQIEIVSWAGGRLPAKLRNGLMLYKDLKRVIQAIKPDLIQSGPLQTAAFLVALSGYRPLVSMSWGYDLLLDARRNFLWSWATRYTLKHSAVMVGDCNTIRQIAIHHGMPDHRIVTFPWGVDLEHFSPDFSKQRKDRQTFTLLSTRGWETIYGVDVLAKAFVQAAQQHPELRLVMLGNGSQAGYLRQTFTRGNVIDQVYFPGQIGQNELPRYYRSADLYVSASRSDGTSISLLEAMACGCPVLVSDIPGNREWVTPGIQGWLFTDGDPNALAKGIVEAIDAHKKLPEMGRTARQLAEQRANWNENFQSLLKAYELAL
jgi:glycosyltransferase involved in cell wall biosynthesis